MNDNRSAHVFCAQTPDNQQIKSAGVNNSAVTPSPPHLGASRKPMQAWSNGSPASAFPQPMAIFAQTGALTSDLRECSWTLHNQA
jgi:hypothetical protein